MTRGTYLKLYVCGTLTATWQHDRACQLLEWNNVHPQIQIQKEAVEVKSKRPLVRNELLHCMLMWYIWLIVATNNDTDKGIDSVRGRCTKDAIDHYQLHSLVIVVPATLKNQCQFEKLIANSNMMLDIMIIAIIRVSFCGATPFLNSNARVKVQKRTPTSNVTNSLSKKNERLYALFATCPLRLILVHAIHNQSRLCTV